MDPDEDRLGPDAFSLTLAQLRSIVSRSRAPIKAVIMDQSRIAGLGNLLCDEALWRAGIDPARAADTLDDDEVRRLHRAIRDTLRILGRRGGSHTGDLTAQRGPGLPCPRDGAPLLRRTVGGRTTYSCAAAPGLTPTKSGSGRNEVDDSHPLLIGASVLPCCLRWRRWLLLTPGRVRSAVPLSEHGSATSPETPGRVRSAVPLSEHGSATSPETPGRVRSAVPLSEARLRHPSPTMPEVRVLVVEDEVKMASLVKRALEREGYAVDVAGTGQDGLWLASENEYDAVVLDVMIPAPNGFEVCRELRARGRWAPVLLLTARDGVDDRVTGLDAGADDYLVEAVLVCRAGGPAACVDAPRGSASPFGPRCR